MSKETVTWELELNTTKAMAQTLVLQRAFNLILRMVARLTGGNESLDALVGMMQRVTHFATQARIALQALHLARMAAGDPFAWITAGVAIGATAVTVVDTAMYELGSK